MSAMEENAPVKVQECWKDIGVWGDKSCPKLIDCLHCRNCEVYSKAGRQLLNRALPDGYVQGWTTLLAEADLPPLPGQISVLIFRIGPEWFALPAGLLIEVLEVRSVHTIPHRSNPVLLGLVNVRGEMQLCVSVGKLLGVDKEMHAERADNQRVKPRMLFIRTGGEQLVFFVNEVCSVHAYHPDELQALPATLSREASDYSKGLLSWKERHVVVLNEQILFEKMIGSIQ